MNIEKMTKLRDWLRDMIPARSSTFNWHVWGMKKHDTDQLITGTELLYDNSCDTCGCVAGWTCALFRPSTLLASFRAPKAAKEELELTEAEAEFLFTPQLNYRWNPLADEYVMAIGLIDDGLRGAISRIDFLLERYGHGKISDK